MNRSRTILVGLAASTLALTVALVPGVEPAAPTAEQSPAGWEAARGESPATGWGHAGAGQSGARQGDAGQGDAGQSGGGQSGGGSDEDEDDDFDEDAGGATCCFF